jgi:GTP-binding protein LepA
MEIIQERLEREFNLDLITTAPSVIYRVTKTDGAQLYIDNPLNYPNPSEIELAEEPFVAASIITPPEYVGNIMELCQDRRGEYKDMQYLDNSRVELHYCLPLNEIIYDFFDALKSRTRGYASLDYELSGYRPSKLVKLDILLNGEIVDALSFIVHADKAYARGRKITERLKENIPRQLFEVPSRPPSAARSSPAKPSRRCARMFWPNATAATSPARKSCSKSRKRAKSACGLRLGQRPARGLYGSLKA